VNLLLDTCTFIWLAARAEQLSAPARAALDDSGNELWISDVSVLEITLKWAAGKLQLPRPPRIWVEAEIAHWRLRRLPLRVGDIHGMGELPAIHPDPFDRLLAAQARERQMMVVTPDENLRRYPIKTLW
jgi:PIN domain nuclease of toxin-antitoxin system